MRIAPFAIPSAIPSAISSGMACLACAWIAAPALAAQPYPNGPVTVVIPFIAGGDTDVVARSMSRHLAKYLNNANFVLENRPGASGSLAALSVKQAAPDGYTMLVGRLASNVIQPALDARTPYRWNDFTILGILELDPLICAVNAQSPYHNVKELIAAAKSQTGHLKYASSGSGTMNNLAVQYWLSLSGLKTDAVEAVHLNGTPEIIQALHNRTAHFFCAPAGGVISHIKAGTVRGLFSTAVGRMAGLPNLPNATEVGLPDMHNMRSWSAVMGPARMQPEVVAQWRAALARLAKDPAWLKETELLNAEPALARITDPTKFVNEQYLLYEKLLISLKLRK